MAALQKLIISVAVQAKVGRTPETDKLAWERACRDSEVEPQGFKFDKAVPFEEQPGVDMLRYSAMGVRRT